MTYEYKCENLECNNSFEIDHGMNEDPKITCNKCESKCERNITGGVGTIFKGGGWTPKSN